MKDIINIQLKEAMKAKNSLRVGTLRMMLTELTSWEKKESNIGKTLDHITVFSSMSKKRFESYTLYIQQNRPDLAEIEQIELQIINEFLPKKMSDEEADIELSKIIQNGDIKEMGKIIKIFNSQFAGMYDNKKLSEKIKLMLTC